MPHSQRREQSAALATPPHLLARTRLIERPFYGHTGLWAHRVAMSVGHSAVRLPGAGSRYRALGAKPESKSMGWCAPSYLALAAAATEDAEFEASTNSRSTGYPACIQALIPPSSGRICLNPARFRCIAAMAADASFGQAQ